MKKYKITYIDKGKVCRLTVDEDQLNNLPKNCIEIKQIKDISLKLDLFDNPNEKDILELFSQINMMLQADLSLIESLELLLQNNHKQKIKEILEVMIRSLHQGKLLEQNLQPFKKYLGELPLIFLSLGQKNGDLKNSVSTLVNIMEQKSKNKKQYKDALHYPMVLSFTFISAVWIIFSYVIPQFEPLFAQYGENLPLMTKVLLQTKDILQDFGIYLMIFIIVLGLILYFWHQNSATFKLNFDKFLLIDLPIVSRVVLLSNMLLVFLTLQLLLKQKYTFQTALKQVINLIQNRHLKMVFKDIEQNILKGDSVDQSFSKFDIFDPLVQKLIFTASRSDQFDDILDKIVGVYQLKFDEKLAKILRLIEPIFLLCIASLIVWIMLAIYIPMWDMSRVL